MASCLTGKVPLISNNYLIGYVTWEKGDTEPQL